MKTLHEKITEAIDNSNDALAGVLHEIFIDTYYKPKPEPKKEVFYHIGQRFKDCGGGEYRLSLVGYQKVNLLSSGGTQCYRANPYIVNDVNKINEAEFKEIYGAGTFTLIEDKK